MNDTTVALPDEQIIAWVRDQPDLFERDAKLTAEEIGDGNVNYVYRVADAKGASVIVKYSAEYIRGSSTRKLSTERADCETKVLEVQGRLAPGLVPQLYCRDRERHLMAMEDLKTITMMRIPLARWQEFPNFAEQIAGFLHDTLVGTSELVMPQMERRALAGELANPAMCEITERLVFTEPYKNRQGLNSYSDEVADLVEQHLYSDGELQRAVARLKHKFQTHQQSLIHGDLHTGSIFVSGRAIKVIDPEFGCFGPAGYDIGNLLANLAFAMAGWEVARNAPETFGPWVVSTIGSIVDRFITLFIADIPAQTTDPMLAGEDFQTRFLADMLRDSAAYAGTEVIRRTVGVAKVTEITSVKDTDRRAALERRLLELGIDLVLSADEFRTGADWVARLEQR